MYYVELYMRFPFLQVKAVDCHQFHNRSQRRKKHHKWKNYNFKLWLTLLTFLFLVVLFLFSFISLYFSVLSASQTWLFSPPEKSGCYRTSFNTLLTVRICLQCRRLVFDPWVGKIPWSRAWQPTPVFWPGKSHGQRSLEGHSLQGHKESDMTETT